MGELEPEERAHMGLFMSFQSPLAIPGVSNVDFLRMAYNARAKAQGKPEKEPLEFYAHVVPILESLNVPQTFLNRSVNEGFSGGERKRNEILQLAVLDADLAILDEIDSGLDVDALREVADAVNGLRRESNAVIMITHYQRLLEYVRPDFVHIIKNGKPNRCWNGGVPLSSPFIFFVAASPRLTRAASHEGGDSNESFYSKK